MTTNTYEARDYAEEAANAELLDTGDGSILHAACGRRSRNGHAMCDECEAMAEEW